MDSTITQGIFLTLQTSNPGKNYNSSQVLLQHQYADYYIFLTTAKFWKLITTLQMVSVLKNNTNANDGHGAVAVIWFTHTVESRVNGYAPMTTYKFMLVGGNILRNSIYNL